MFGMRSSTARLWNLAPLVCALTCPANFEDAQIAAEKSGMEWLDEFAGREGRDLEPLWRALDCNDPTPQFEQRLLALHSSVREKLGFEAIDAALDLRHVPHPCAGIPEFQAPEVVIWSSTFAVPRFPYALPLPLLDLTDEEVVTHLASNELELRTRAAFTLICRQRHVGAVVNVLIDRLVQTNRAAPWEEWGDLILPAGKDRAVSRERLDAYALTFAKEMLGDACDDVLLARLATADDDSDLRRFLIEFVGFSGRSDPRVLLAALEPWIEDGGATARAILQRALATWGCPTQVSEGEYLNPYTHAVSSWTEGPELAASLEDVATRVIARGFDVLHRANDVEAADLRLLVYPLERNALARERVLPVVRAISAASGPAADEALRIRGYVGDDDARVRAAYVERLTRRIATEPRSSRDLVVGGEAILVHHDAGTLDCLTRAIETSRFHEDFACALRCIRDPDPDLVPRIEALKQRIVPSVERPGDWGPFLSCDWPGEPAVLAGDSPTTRIEKLAMAIQSRRTERRDDSDLVDALAHVLDDVKDLEGGFGEPMTYEFWCLVIEHLELSHPAITSVVLRHLFGVEGYCNNDMCRVLLRATLDREQARALARSEPFFVSSHDIAEVLADQEHGLFEVIPRVRLAFLDDLHPQDDCGRQVLALERLDWIFRSGAVSRAAEEWLVLALEQGHADHRERALEIVAERNVELPAVMKAVEELQSDCDTAVRTRAQGILRQRRGK